MSLSPEIIFEPSLAARSFVQARLAGVSLPAYPGPLPNGPADAYACQEAALGLWPDEVAGWKVGRIGAAAAEYGGDRLAGPVFRRNVWEAQPGAPTSFPVIEGGFAAVEAEFVFVLRTDAPADKLNWTREEAAALDWELRLGVEIAGSPLAAINDLGPAVTISDFGNNAGLIVGPELPGGLGAIDTLRCEAIIDGRSVGAGSATDLPGGPLEGVRFLLAHVARHGRSLRVGQMVSSGALTGVHRIHAGQAAEIRFGEVAVLTARAVSASPEAARRPGSMAPGV